MSRSLVARLFVSAEQRTPAALGGIAGTLRLAGFAGSREPGQPVRSWTNADDGRRVRWTNSVEDALAGFDGARWWGIALHKASSDRPGAWHEVLLEVLPPDAGDGGGLGTIALSLPFMSRPADQPVLAQEFAAWVVLLASVTHPWYGWAGSDLGLFNREATPVDPAEVRAVALQPLEWLNVYGGPYVARLGRERLLAAPAWRADVLADGSIAVVLSRHPLQVAWEEAAAVALHLGVPIVTQ
jgi:hypothetical protein